MTIYYLYSSGHLLKVSGVGIVVPRLSSLKGLGSTNAPTTTDVRRQQGIEIDAPSGAEEGSPSVSVTGLSTSRTEPITTAPTPTTTAPPSTSSPTLHVGRTKHGSDEQERRLTLAERVELPQDGSDIYISVLTTPGYHDSRLSRQYITWMQTVHPKQVSALPTDECCQGADPVNYLMDGMGGGHGANDFHPTPPPHTHTPGGLHISHTSMPPEPSCGCGHIIGSYWVLLLSSIAVIWIVRLCAMY